MFGALFGIASLVLMPFSSEAATLALSSAYLSSPGIWVPFLDLSFASFKELSGSKVCPCFPLDGASAPYADSPGVYASTTNVFSAAPHVA